MTADDMSCRLGRGISLGNLFIGEFGSYERAGQEARRQWTGFVRLEAERLGLSWCYWDFGTDFGAFDPRRNAWREPLRDALLGNASPPVG
jgi:endoglucanase